MKYIRKSSVFNIGYHIILTPKYRKPFLLRFENILFSCFKKTSHKYNFAVECIEIMPDHIHLFIRAKSTTFDVSKVVHHLKGYSSFFIRKKYAFLKKYKAFWSASYFVETIGNISESVVKKYIKNQRVSMKPTYKYKYIVQRHIKKLNFNINNDFHTINNGG